MRDREQARALLNLYLKNELRIPNPEDVPLFAASNMRDSFFFSSTIYNMVNALPANSSLRQQLKHAESITFIIPFMENNDTVTYRIN